MLDFWVDIKWFQQVLLSNTLVGLVTRFFTCIFYWLFYVPLFVFYLHAPYWLGGWDSKEVQEICSSKTGINASFWLQHIHSCQNLVQSGFHTWISPFILIIYILAAFKLVFCISQFGFMILAKVIKNVTLKVSRHIQK